MTAAPTIPHSVPLNGHGAFWYVLLVILIIVALLLAAKLLSALIDLIDMIVEDLFSHGYRRRKHHHKHTRHSGRHAVADKEKGIM